MDIEAIVKKHLDANWYGEDSTGYDDVAEAMRDALTELSAAHAIEMRAYEATVQNQAERIRQLEVALTGMVAIAHDSDGVAGYHLNGDVADWYSFPEYEAAVIALADAPQQEKEPRHD